MSSAVTQGIRVAVTTQYLADRSVPTGRQFAFAYTIRISNEGQSTAKLLTRHWIIMNGEGIVQEVKGEGVVGVQPVLEPGQSFEYTSGCILETPYGTMQGTYHMVRNDGGAFEVEIAPFLLSVPNSLN